MNRPPEYDRLIKDRALEEVQPTPGAIAGYLKNAADSRQEAAAVIAVLEKCIPAAYQLTNTQLTTK